MQSLKTGRGDGTYRDMERVAKLEARVDHMQNDMVEIKADLRSINEKLGILVALPTKGNLLAYTLASLTIALAIIGCIIGGLGWIQHH